MEYIKLEPEEQNNSKKDLLESQMHVLELLKRYQKFKELRNLEVKLKSVFKRQLSEIQLALQELEKILPKTHQMVSDVEKAKVISKGKTRLDLESEIEEIKRKLAQLS